MASDLRRDIEAAWVQHNQPWRHRARLAWRRAIAPAGKGAGRLLGAEITWTVITALATLALAVIGYMALAK